MLFCGDTNSPDKLAPDIIPVTPENKTPKTMKKSTSTKGSEQSLEYLEVFKYYCYLLLSLENHFHRVFLIITKKYTPLAK